MSSPGSGAFVHENGDPVPPMCGHTLFSKVLGSHQKKQKEIASSRRSLFLRRIVANSTGYDDVVSLEQQQDTESESSKDSNERRASMFPDKDLQLPNLVQFDPKELEEVKKEKESAEIDLSGKNRQPRGRSPFWGLSLPTVKEEKSFDSEEKSTAQSSLLIDQALLRFSPSVSASSSSSSTSSASFSFFDKLNGDTCNDKTDVHQDGPVLKESSENMAPLDDSQTSISSPQKMELLKAMREVILKQQDAVKAMSKQNKELEGKLSKYRSNMKDIVHQSEQQKVRISQLQLQKKASESESDWLKAEIVSLKSELESIKSYDDLADRFEKLMEDDTRTHSYESLSLGDDDHIDKSAQKGSGVGIVEGEEKGILSSSQPFDEDPPLETLLEETTSQILDDREWNRLISSYEQYDKERANLASPPNDGVTLLNSTINTENQEDESVSTFGTSTTISHESVATAAATIAGFGGNVAGRHKGEVDAFKNRLDKIQKQRKMRQSPSGRKATVVRFA